MEIPGPSDTPLLSVIIPVRNDATVIALCLSTLLSENGQFEIVVVDGESEDGTIAAASTFPEVKIISSPPGHARQMNAGTRVAYGDTFLFLDPETILKPGWYQEVLRFESLPTNSCGAFPVTFSSPLLRFRILAMLINARMKFLKSPPGGHGLLVRRSSFKELGGFRDWPILESTDLIRRLRKRGHLYIASLKATVSTTPWSREGIIRRSLRLCLIHGLYKSGVSPKRLVHLHAPLPMTVAVFSDSSRQGNLMQTSAKNADLMSIIQYQRKLLAHTWAEVCHSGESACLYHPREQHDRLFHNVLGLEVRCRSQAGGNLGHRLECAFRELVGTAESPAIIVFSISPALPADMIKMAAEALNTHDAVMGRTDNGSIYLIGLSRYHSGLFDQVTWNSDHAFDETLKRLQTYNFKVHTMPSLPAADFEELTLTATSVGKFH